MFNIIRRAPLQLLLMGLFLGPMKLAANEPGPYFFNYTGWQKSYREYHFITYFGSEQQVIRSDNRFYFIAPGMGWQSRYWFAEMGLSQLNLGWEILPGTPQNGYYKSWNLAWAGAAGPGVSYKKFRFQLGVEIRGDWNRKAFGIRAQGAASINRELEWNVNIDPQVMFQLNQQWSIRLSVPFNCYRWGNMRDNRFLRGAKELVQDQYSSKWNGDPKIRFGILYSFRKSGKEPNS